MIAATLALAAALVLAVSSKTTKHLAVSFPHRQLIAPLLLLNALLVTPLGFASAWRIDRDIVLLQVASAATLVAGSFCMFELFAEGSAAAVAVGQALTPVPTLAFAVLLLEVPVTAWQTVGDLVVTGGVLVALGPVFGRLSRTRAVTTLVLAAALNGLLVVLTKLLTDRGAGVAEIYSVRAGLAGLVACVLAPPREIPRSALPKLTYRSALQSAYFVLVILAVERGSPATVQTLVSTTPLMLLAADAFSERRRPPLRLLAAAAGVIVGVALAVG